MLKLLRPYQLSLLLLLHACAPMQHHPGPATTNGHLLDNTYITRDNTSLPLKSWHNENISPRAVIVAIHGFNDYSQFFHLPASYLQNHGIISYAYDQRGFGGSPQPGHWGGVQTYVNDLLVFVQLIREKHPQLPIYLLGESMGGAVVLINAAQYQSPHVNGIILCAPAIWSRQLMPWYQQSLLWLLAHTTPTLTLTGKGLKVQASDNIAVLRAMAKDPLIIKETRVESIYGLANLMDAANASASLIKQPALLLYGLKDEIIPQYASEQFRQQFLSTHAKNKTVIQYPQGYHLLLRDLQAENVWRDIVSWITTTKQTSHSTVRSIKN